ncbi:MAG TPA: hypothetical protein VFC24_13700 [Casimicrobiaceae bacterium]|nr:hypothetical protein [Casimicrobiaceae bacterium]
MKRYTHLFLAVGLALAFSGAARADGDGGDNSMSQWTGESYAAFHRGEVGDFYTDPSELARTNDSGDKRDEGKTRLAGSSAMTAQPGNPFRDDTAA